MNKRTVESWCWDRIKERLLGQGDFYSLRFRIESKALPSSCANVSQHKCWDASHSVVTEQIDSMLPCVCPVIDHRWR